MNWNPLSWFGRSRAPSDDFYYGRALKPTHAGADVDETLALNQSAVFNAITIIASTIGSLPLHLYRQAGEKREKATDHPLYDVLHTAANPEMTAMQCREAGAGHAVSWGNCFAEKAKNKRGEIAALYPITPNRVEIHRKKGQIVYIVTVGAKRIPFLREDILHVPGMGFDGLQGYSVLTKARESIALGLAVEEYGARFFGSGTHPGVIASHPGHLKQEAYDRLKESLKNAYEGLGKAHRLMLLEEGIQLEKLGLPPNDSQFLETRQFQIPEIARWFNIQPHKLKDHSRSTFNNIEHLQIDHVVDCIRPWLVRFEQCYNHQLLTEKERKAGLFFAHNVEGLLRGDSASRAEFYSKMWGMGALTINEIRGLENMNPIQGGNTHFVPLNMVPLELAENPPAPAAIPEKTEPAGDDKEEKNKRSITPPKTLQNGHLSEEQRSIAGRDRVAKQYKRLFVEAAQTLISYESLRIKKSITRSIKQRSTAVVKEEIEQLYQDMPDKIKRKMGPVLLSYAEAVIDQAAREISADPEMTPELEAFVANYVDGYTARHVNRSRGQLMALVDDQDLEAVEARVDEWQEKRPEKIALEETVRAGSAVAAAVFFAGGFQTVWRTRGPKTCPYCTELEGRKISSGQSFIPAGTNWEPDGAKNGPMKIRGMKMHPPLHSGCDCYISAG